MTTRRDRECRVLLERLSAYLDGDLSSASCAAIERHARSCRRCATVIADFRKATGLCRRIAATPLPAAVRTRARARVRKLLDDTR